MKRLIRDPGCTAAWLGGLAFNFGFIAFAGYLLWQMIR